MRIPVVALPEALPPTFPGISSTGIELSRESSIPVLEIPGNVGGRYSVLTPVGLFSALFSGLDINALMEGARCASQYCWEHSVEENPAAISALLYYLYFTRKNIHVFWSYATPLEALCQWFCQLWAESLGKIPSGTRRKIPLGQTPLPVIGPRDQHSLLQLFVEGPPDKMYTLLRIHDTSPDLILPGQVPSYDSFSMLKECSLTTINKSEQKAIESVLIALGRPMLCFELQEISEFHLSQFLYLLEFITALTGIMLGINPFDQPGVEEGKKFTCALLNHPRYAAKKAELDSLYAHFKSFRTR